MLFRSQERYVRDAQVESSRQGRTWSWSILRPVLIVGESVGSAMNVIPALGVYAAMMRRAGKTALDYPGGVGRVAHVDVRLQLADAGIHIRGRSEIRQILARDTDYVGTMLSEGLCAGRAGEHSREVEHAHTRKGAVTPGQRLRWRFADLDDFKQRNTGGGFLMRFALPFGLGADKTPAAAVGEHGRLQFK